MAVVPAIRPAPGTVGRESLLEKGRKVQFLNMSSGVSVSFAPSLISPWQPRLRGLWMDPGTANTSLPSSFAARAVISEPLLGAASTTRVPRLKPAMMRLRCGKLAAQRRAAEREFADQGALNLDGFAELGIAARIDHIEPAAEHRQSDALRRQGPAMRDRYRCRVRARW